MSKANRRRQRPGTNPSTRPASPPPSSATPTPTPTPSASSGASSGAAGSSTPPTKASSTSTGSPTGTPRPSSTRPTSARAGRRERQRSYAKPSFRERYRTAIIVVAALVGVAVLSTFVFLSASQPAFACSTIWSPTPTSPPAAGATPALGYVQPQSGGSHVGVGEKVTYTYCAPASGSHINRAGAGPIAARVYGPNDTAIPQGWLHNLEHGGLVILYQGTSAGATPEGQEKMRAFHAAFPPAADCGPVIARFDQMSTPFQALVWGRVLMLDTFDEAMITAFWDQWGGLTNPEKLCPAPDRPSPSPATSEAPSAAPSEGPSAAPSTAPSLSAAPSVAPSTSTAPSPSAAPSPS